MITLPLPFWWDNGCKYQTAQLSIWGCSVNKTRQALSPETEGNNCSTFNSPPFPVLS